MARLPRIPHELTNRPFSLREARAAGLTPSALKGQAWRRIGTRLYCWRGIQIDHWLLLAAWQRILPASAIFAGATAAWLWGLDFEPVEPVEIIVSAGTAGIRSGPELRVRRCGIARADIARVRGLRATTVHRTLSDLSLRWSNQEALVAVDTAIHLGLTDADALGRFCAKTKGRPGAHHLRSLAALAAPAESPMETRLRWLLLSSGLPSPNVQADLRNSGDRFVGRADLYYPVARLVIEYDGGNHRDRLVEDDRRQNLIINAGYRLLRFTAADVHHRPDVVVRQVRNALGLAPNMRNSGKRGARLASEVRNARFGGAGGI